MISLLILQSENDPLSQQGAQSSFVRSRSVQFPLVNELGNYRGRVLMRPALLRKVWQIVTTNQSQDWKSAFFVFFVVFSWHISYILLILLWIVLSYFHNMSGRNTRQQIKTVYCHFFVAFRPSRYEDISKCRIFIISGVPQGSGNCWRLWDHGGVGLQATLQRLFWKLLETFRNIQNQWKIWILPRRGRYLILF